MVNSALNLPFQEQLAFWEQKEVKGTEHWLSIRRNQHDKHFVVAGAMKADLLHDLQKALHGQQGGTLENFRKNFRQIVKKHGWTGWKGEGSKAGEAWRTKIIWQTNIRTSYAAGRYAQLTSPEAKAALPYWKYCHSGLSAKPRQDHLAWDGLTLPHDHPFWKKAFPPNGFGCGCYVTGVDKPEAGALTQPPEGWEKQIDKGWDYCPGATVSDEVRRIVEMKAAKYPEQLARDFLAQAEEVGIVPDMEKIAADRSAKVEGDARKWLVQQGRKTGCEHAVVYDAATGKEIGRYEGQDRNRFYLPEDIIKRTHDRSENLALLHNHPASDSVSMDDLLILARPGVGKMVAFGHSGGWYAAEKGTKMGILERVLEAANTELDRQLSLLALRYVYPTGMEVHIRNLALARAGIIQYRAGLDNMRARTYARGKDAIEAAVQEIVFAIERVQP